MGWYEFDATRDYYNGGLVIYSKTFINLNPNHSSAKLGNADWFYADGATQFQASLTVTSLLRFYALNTNQNISNVSNRKKIVVTGASLKCGNGATAYAVDKWCYFNYRYS